MIIKQWTAYEGIKFKQFPVSSLFDESNHSAAEVLISVSVLCPQDIINIPD